MLLCKCNLSECSVLPESLVQKSHDRCRKSIVIFWKSPENPLKFDPPPDCFYCIFLNQCCWKFQLNLFLEFYPRFLLSKIITPSKILSHPFPKNHTFCDKSTIWQHCECQRLISSEVEKLRKRDWALSWDLCIGLDHGRLDSEMVYGRPAFWRGHGGFCVDSNGLLLGLWLLPVPCAISLAQVQQINESNWWAIQRSQHQANLLGTVSPK